MEKKLIVFGSIGGILLWGILLFMLISKSRVEYYVIEDINVYLAVDRRYVYINSSSYEISNKGMLRGWSSHIKKNEKGSTTLILPRGTGNIVAVHTDGSLGRASDSPWLLWLPNDIDEGAFPNLTVYGHDVRSDCFKIRHLKHSELSVDPHKRKRALGKEAAEEVIWFLKEIGVPDHPAQFDVVKEKRYCLKVCFSNGDYIYYDETPVERYDIVPVLYKYEPFPSTVVLNGYPHGDFHLKETVVLEFGGVEYEGYMNYPPYNDFFLSSPYERVVLSEYNKSAANK